MCRFFHSSSTHLQKSFHVHDSESYSHSLGYVFSLDRSLAVIRAHSHGHVNLSPAIMSLRKGTEKNCSNRREITSVTNWRRSPGAMLSYNGRRRTPVATLSLYKAARSHFSSLLFCRDVSSSFTVSPPKISSLHLSCLSNLAQRKVIVPRPKKHPVSDMQTANQVGRGVFLPYIQKGRQNSRINRPPLCFHQLRRQWCDSSVYRRD